jgi:hypothetical protein
MFGSEPTLRSLYYAICQEQQNILSETDNMRRDFQLSGHPQRFIASVIKYRSSRPERLVGVYPLCEGHLREFQT